jgi:hypothetical protein
MRLGEIFVLADKEDGRNPELLRFVLLQPVANDFCLTNVGAGRSRGGVGAREDVAPSLVELFPLK